MIRGRRVRPRACLAMVANIVIPASTGNRDEDIRHFNKLCTSKMKFIRRIADCTAEPNKNSKLSF
jgi:hypothetical protein